MKQPFTEDWLRTHNARLAKTGHRAAQVDAGATIATPAKASKHRNRKVAWDGFTFDSQKECERYQALKLLLRVGAIKNLQLQQSFDLYGANGERVARYVADFVYWSVEFNRQIVEDVKSPHTRTLPVYRLKMKLLRAQGTAITEV